MTLRFPILAGIAVSVLVHLGLAGGVLLLADVRPFADAEQRIEVDVVSADDAPPVPEPKPDAAASATEAIELPKPAPAEREPAKPRPDAAKAEPPPQPADPPPQQPNQQKQPEQQQTQAAAPPPDATPAAAPFPAAIPQPPDITVKYAVSLGLPTVEAFDAPAELAAQISADAATALRQRLKSCAALPPSLTRTDKVKIVLRVALLPDGRLAQDPVLIEASASAKGPALMQGAIAALTACQPYSMLPTDKYQEWKVLDLGFTPQDFRDG